VNPTSGIDARTASEVRGMEVAEAFGGGGTRSMRHAVSAVDGETLGASAEVWHPLGVAVRISTSAFLLAAGLSALACRRGETTLAAGSASATAPELAGSGSAA
jgi:hypothetical protein